LSAALGAAQAGDIIVLAPGTYAGTFAIQASGTQSDPIVIRGEDARGVVIDGQGCTGCNVLEVYGSFVHVEDLTIANGERGVRFQGVGAEGNVLRRTIVSNVVHGIGSREGQLDFYVCDNEIVGRLDWPWVFDADASSHWDDRGVDLNGDGHVICHNRIEGFGDPMVNLTEGTRAWDFYGNDVYDCFDGIEVDRVAGNVRVFRNRWTNVDSAISMQPVNGGPVYVLRNELLNVVSEQLKLKATGGEPSGALVHHNTFVSPSLALNLQTPITGHNFVISNNLFVGPDALAGSRTVDWTAGVDGGRFDFNGYYPDGGFWFGVVDGTNRLYGSFAEAMASGELEGSGVLLVPAIFAGGIVGPADPTVAQTAAELELDAASNAIDAGEPLPGLNDGHLGAGPDLGAREVGCAAPVYGPRPNEADYVPVDCSENDDGGDEGGSSGGDDSGSDGGDTEPGSGTSESETGPDSAGPGSAGEATDTDGSGGGSNDDGSSGCSCRSNTAPPIGALVLVLVAAARRRHATTV
jgi:MYXO-CTERM domain-containing protein